REHEIEDQWREEQRHRSRGEPVLRQVVVDEDAVDTDRRERAGQCPVDDEQAGHELVDPVPAGEGQRQGAMMATAKSAPRAMRIAVSAKNIHGIRPMRPPTMRTHQRTMTSMTPLFCAKPNR